MPSSFLPVGLFVALVVSVIVALSAGGAALALIAAGGFMATLAALAWVVLRADRAADPLHGMLRAADRFDDRWCDFERDFWAHVSAGNAAK
jgi:hypothetical protein